MREGIEKGKLSITLRGEKLKGSFALVRTSDGKSWLMIKHKDRFVSTVASAKRTARCCRACTVEDLTTVPAHRIPAERLAANGPTERCQKRCRRCMPRPPTPRLTTSTGCGSRSSMAIECSHSSITAT